MRRLLNRLGFTNTEDVIALLVCLAIIALTIMQLTAKHLVLGATGMFWQ